MKYEQQKMLRLLHVSVTCLGVNLKFRPQSSVASSVVAVAGRRCTWSLSLLHIQATSTEKEWILSRKSCGLCVRIL